MRRCRYNGRTVSGPEKKAPLGGNGRRASIGRVGANRAVDSGGAVDANGHAEANGHPGPVGAAGPNGHEASNGHAPSSGHAAPNGRAGSNGRVRSSGSNRHVASTGLGGSTGAGRLFGSVDYTLAKRALLSEFHGGLLSRLEICDAHPELLRAAKYVGEPTARPCPVCDSEGLRLLAYVYADDLKANNGRVWELREALAVTAAHRGGSCYVVEVCTRCSWNHLYRSFRARSAG
jgi:hypothetical protein